MGFLMAGLSAFLVYGFFVFGVPQTLWYTLFLLLAGLIVSSATVSFWLALATFIKKGEGACGFVPGISKYYFLKCFFSVALAFFCTSFFIPGIVSCYLEVIGSSYSLTNADWKTILEITFQIYWLPYLCAYISSVGLAGFAMARNEFQAQKKRMNFKHRRKE